MPVVGSIETVKLTLDVFGSDTAATLTVVQPDGQTAPGDVTKVDEDGGKTWLARVVYTMPGVWDLSGWRVTGTGEGRPEAPYRVAVAPAPGTPDGRHTYATSVDLANYLRDAPPLDADRLLRDASAALDDVLVCSVYDVDAVGMPTDAAVQAVLRDAACAVVKWRDASGYDETAAGDITSASIAGVSLGFASGGTTGPRDGIGGEARQLLRQAGLLGTGPWY